MGVDTIELHPFRYTLKKTVKGIGRAIKRTGDKANPFDKHVNYNDTTDTGYESLKLGYRTVKKTYKASKNTVHAGKVIYKAPARTVKITVGTVKVMTSVVIHTVSLLMSPVFWIFVIILLLAYLCIFPIMLILLGGGAAASSGQAKAYSSAAGVKDIVNEYSIAESLYDSACTEKQSAFDSMIDSMYFSVDDLTNSDLVYMKLNDNTEFSTSLATDNRKQQLKETFSNSVSKNEAIALAYVYLEKQVNDVNFTDGLIYEVEFSEEIFRDLLDMIVSYTETTYEGQECPQKNCTSHEEEKSNPRYEELTDKVSLSADAYNDWTGIIPYIANFNSIRDGRAQSQYWDNNIQWQIDNWLAVYGDLIPVYPYYVNNGENFLRDIGDLYEYYSAELDNTPPTIITRTWTCEHQHHLHSIGLTVRSKDTVMDAWEFDESYRQWVELTIQGFKRNPNIQTE